jgi:hypothetical protein
MKLEGTRAIVLLSTLIIMSCEKNVNPSSACTALSDSTAIELKYGQKIFVCNNDSSCIRFAKIVSESRCPSDVVCVWAGTAMVELETCDPEGEVINLEIYKSVEYAVNGQKYSLELTSLTPYPSVAHPAEMNDYTAMVTLKKK